ncbi:MAG: MBOAT family protein, partial [Cyanobacteriota bacterium]|nr:MBOAT family protein [Cyanobacteriota bacterium]
MTSFKIASASRRKKITWLLIGLSFNLLILGFFKYGALIANLFTSNLAASEDSIFTFLLRLPLPIGISFYTFEGISLLIDVLRTKSNQEEASFVDANLNKHLLNTSFFIAFFPHLIAGPILKPNNFYPQIKPKYLNQIPWNIVFRSLVIGYFLKMVIADNLKDYTFWIAFPYYQSLSTFTGIVLLFGYSIQIFADFAGYSLIAIGTAAAFGYTLPQNFNFPYISRSLSEFWQRWHISLSSWLKDYLYIPLGGNRKGKLRTYANLMIVMVLGGLWHGASWSYAVWGAFHGVGLILERFFNDRFQTRLNNSLPIWLQLVWELIKIIFIFSFVSIGWLLFKLPNFAQALDFLSIMSQNLSLPTNRALTTPVLLFSIPVIVYHLLHLPTLRLLQIEHYLKSNLPLRKIFRDLAFGGMVAMIILNSGTS